MLTGDKMETAKCISKSTGLYNSEDKMWVISEIHNVEDMDSKLRELLNKLEKIKHVKKNI